MSDVQCPHCGEYQEICHDDGQGYDEDVEHSQTCASCGYEFKFTTSVSYSYDVFCSGEHELEQSPVEKYHNIWSCSKCDYFEQRPNQVETTHEQAD